MMVEAVVFADDEQFLIDALTPALAAQGLPVPVGSKIPSQDVTPYPDSFVVLYRVGGVDASIVVDAATVSVDSYAPLETPAKNLALTVRAVMHALPLSHAGTVYDVVEFAGPGNLPDPQIPDRVRYRQTFSVQIAYDTTIEV